MTLLSIPTSIYHRVVQKINENVPSLSPIDAKVSKLANDCLKILEELLALVVKGIIYISKRLTTHADALEGGDTDDSNDHSEFKVFCNADSGIFAHRGTKTHNGERQEDHYEIENFGSYLVYKSGSEEIQYTKKFERCTYFNTNRVTGRIDYDKNPNGHLTLDFKTSVRTRYFDLKHPYVQDFRHGLTHFLRSRKTEFKFCRYDDSFQHDIQNMVATKTTKTKNLRFYGVPYAARHVHITLQDRFFSRFWHADLWYDSNTYQVLEFHSKPTAMALPQCTQYFPHIDNIDP